MSKKVVTSELKGRTVTELAAAVGGRVVGDSDDVLITKVAAFETAEHESITFVEDARLLSKINSSQASCVIVVPGADTSFAPRIEARNPKLAFAFVAKLLHPPKQYAPGIHPTAVVHPSADIDESVYVGAYVQIGERARVAAQVQLHSGTSVGSDVQIGRGSIALPNVVLYENISIGERVILHAGVVIGADGFGYVRDDSSSISSSNSGDAAGYVKFPQIGTVVIEDDVEIGAQTCIDRAALGETRIGSGTKIDNLVQVGHNVSIGARVVIAAQTGISGSTVIEDDAVIGGQVGMGDHARVGRAAVIGSKAGILPGKIVRPGAVMWGVPVRPLDEYKRLNAHFGRLPQMRAEINELRQQLKELTEKLK